VQDVSENWGKLVYLLPVVYTRNACISCTRARVRINVHVHARQSLWQRCLLVTNSDSAEEKFWIWDSIVFRYSLPVLKIYNACNMCYRFLHMQLISESGLLIIHLVKITKMNDIVIPVYRCIYRLLRCLACIRCKVRKFV